MNFGGFKISKKAIIIVVAIIAVIIISTKVSEAKKQKELEERNAAILAQTSQNQQVGATPTPMTLNDQIQAQLVEKFGVAPEGFKWAHDGSLVPLSDDSLTAEDVLYTFLRSLSMLDFSTAERYSSNSTIIDAYQSFYGVGSQVVTNHYDNFLRKQFKYSLTSLEAKEVGDTAVFADGTMYMTLNIAVLDLTDKDFWLKDRDELFSTMKVYRETEADEVKLEQYLYDYIIDAYQSKEFKKKDYTIDIVVSKGGNGGWLVSNDKELLAKLQYENGVNVASFILNEFQKWYLGTYNY